jgi:hypothetical protein
MDNPKKKKLRHLQVLGDSADSVADLLRIRRKPQDAELRNAIRQKLDKP